MNKFTHGLMVVSEEEFMANQERLNVKHFVGYWKEPTEVNMEDLRRELKETEEFGLTDEIDKLTIALAPQFVIDALWKKLEEDNIKSQLNKNN